MMRVKRCEGGRLRFFCPGCNENHMVRVDAPEGRNWGWNGSLEKPTLTPSVLTWIDPNPKAQWEPYISGRRCHSFVTDGRIQFLGDCSHALAGQTVDLPEIEA